MIHASAFTWLYFYLIDIQISVVAHRTIHFYKYIIMNSNLFRIIYIIIYW